MINESYFDKKKYFKTNLRVQFIEKLCQQVNRRLKDFNGYTDIRRYQVKRKSQPLFEIKEIMTTFLAKKEIGYVCTQTLNKQGMDNATYSLTVFNHNKESLD